MTDLRTGRFAAHGLLNEPPDSVREVLGHQAADELSPRTSNWLHRETYRAQGQAVAMNLCDAMTSTVDPTGLLYDGAPPASLTVNAAVYDYVGDYYLISTDDATNRAVRLSGDSGLTTSEAYTAAGTAIDTLAIVPGSWVFGSIDGSNWVSSASPYTSWTTVSAATFTPANMGAGFVVSTLDGVESLLVGGFTGGTAYLAHTPVATRPTVAGDWTELTPATLSHIYGIATDGALNVIAGSIGGVTPTIAYAGIADGGLTGDWTTVTVGTGSYVRDVTHDGEKFVCVDDNGDVHYSFDAATWTQTGVAGAAGTQYFLASDPSTGFLVSYRPTSATTPLYVSRDGVAWIQATANSTITAVGGLQGRWGFDTRKGRLFAGDGATVAGLRATG